MVNGVNTQFADRPPELIRGESWVKNFLFGKGLSPILLHAEMSDDYLA